MGHGLHPLVCSDSELASEAVTLKFSSRGLLGYDAV